MEIIIEKAVNKGYIVRLGGREFSFTAGVYWIETWEEVLKFINQTHEAFIGK